MKRIGVVAKTDRADAREVVADARVEHGTAEAQWECEPGVGPGRQTSHILL